MDVVYLPPVEAELDGLRDDLAGRWRSAGVPLVVQQLIGRPVVGTDSTEYVWDLLPALLEGRLDLLDDLPRGAAAVWPLVAGLTDGEAMVEEGLARLARRDVAAIQPMVLELSSSGRRQLARGADEGTFDRLFHGRPPSAREFSSRAAARGLSTFLARPLPAGPPRLVVRRRCSGELRLAAELQHLLGLPELDSQKLLRSARWIDREDHDLAALAAENNLTIVEWFDGASRRVIEEVLEQGRSSLVAELEAEYTRAEG
jgi:hypothetical protein